MTYSPRWYQTEAAEAFWQFLCADKRNPVIVLPTGSGKSLLLAMLAHRAVTEFEGRVLILQHRKELIEQNAEKVRALLPDVPVGIYSAGLNSRDTDEPVLLAGIQSIYNKAHLIGMRHLILIDEVHLVPTDGQGMYLTFLEDLKKYVTKFRIGGMTATPFRTDSGPLCAPDNIFQKICYTAPVKKLIDEGYLCSVTTKAGDATVDTSKIGVRAGEFIQHEMDQVFGDEAKIDLACREIVARTKDRHSVLVFCSGVSHARRVAMKLTELTGDVAGVVVGDTEQLVRYASLLEFREMGMKYLCNCDVLTTGFDAPVIDCIAVLRATMSPGLYCQMVGRGLRVHASKQNCLILDFGENIQRHGAIDAVDYGRGTKGHGETTGEAPVKSCPNCKSEVAIAAVECPDCHFLFPPRELKHQVRPDESSTPIQGDAPIVYNVESWSAWRHVKKKKKEGEESPDSLRIDYFCTLPNVPGMRPQKVSAWICIAHCGFAGTKAEAWWQQHTRAPFTDNIDHAISLFHAGAFAMPTQIEVVKEGPFDKIVKETIPELPTEWVDASGMGDAFEGPTTTNEWGEPVPSAMAVDYEDVPF